MNDHTRIGIERWAAERPHQLALVEGERSLTWAELDDLANRLAQGLHEREVRQGDIVVVRTHTRLEWGVIAGALAKLGCTQLGLNWRLTAEESRYVLADSGAAVVFCDDADPAALTPALERLPIKLAISLDAPAAGFVSFDALLESRPAPRHAQSEPSLIIYTSGTTGLPKGVRMGGSASIDAQTVREYRESVEGYRRVLDGDVTLITMPMHHGSGPAQFWASARQGNKTVLQRRFNPEEALQLISRHQITAWTGVPTMFRRMAALPPEVLGGFDVSSILHLSVGAAPVPFALKEWILDYFGADTLQEGYGASEVGMISVLTPAMQRLKPGSSGLPHRHVTVQVRDAQGNCLPPGQPGDLWVKTPVTIRSYLNAPPLGPDTVDAEGFFKVGDVGYLDADGYLFITDRAKDMIISGGVNIYPAEIEAALMTYPAILEAAVIGIPDDDFGEQVLAFCELKPGHQADEADVLAHCSQHLASYKRPRRIEFMQELPRNTMGKLLKRELRDPYWKGKERRV